jgi:purine-nucleoside phosphorylase
MTGAGEAPMKNRDGQTSLDELRATLPAALLQTLAKRPAVAAVVLGSGMGQTLASLSRDLSVAFADLPDLAETTVPGHRGCLGVGDWQGRRVLVFEGRLHHYEGHPWQRVVQPVRIARALGARVLLLTNAAGGIRDDLLPGTLMLLRDHIEWTRPDCWKLPQRPSPYSAGLSQRLQQAAAGLGAPLPQGVYAAVTGPSYETPAEIRALRAWGADAVGMSTAREAQAACDLGMECAAVSLITNRAAGLSSGPIHHDEVLATAAAAAGRLVQLLEGFLRECPGP